MPELPEVETVARDLRPRLVGATIVGARVSWAANAARPRPGRVRRRASPAGGSLAVGRRAKQLVIELVGDAALTIHLKMTGQLFVVPADVPEDPYVRLVLELADGRELRFRDIRKFGRVGLYGRDPVTGDLVTEVGGASVFAAIGPEPLADEFTLRAFRRRLRRRKGRLKPLLLDQSFVAGIGNIYADEALWAARLHPLRTAGTLRPPDERRLYEAIRAVLAEAVERRGSSIDDYTAPDGDGSMQERLARLPAHRRAVPPLRPADQADRRRRRGRRTSARGASACRRATGRAPRPILRTMTGGAGPDRAALDGARAGTARSDRRATRPSAPGGTRTRRDRGRSGRRRRAARARRGRVARPAAGG